MSAWYSISLMIHLVALALWLGGIVFFLIVLGPAVHELEPRIAIKTMNRARIGLEMVSWTAIGLLLVTGIVNLLIRTQATAAAPSGARTSRYRGPRDMPGRQHGPAIGPRCVITQASARRARALSVRIGKHELPNAVAAVDLLPRVT